MYRKTVVLEDAGDKGSDAERDWNLVNVLQNLEASSLVGSSTVYNSKLQLLLELMQIWFCWIYISLIKWWWSSCSPRVRIQNLLPHVCIRILLLWGHGGLDYFWGCSRTLLFRKETMSFTYNAYSHLLNYLSNRYFNRFLLLPLLIISGINPKVSF